MTTTYTPEPLQIGWTLAACTDVFEWSSPVTVGQPPNFTVPVDLPVHFAAGVIGVNTLGAFTATLTSGSTSLTSIANAGNVAVGQLLFGDGIPPGSRIATWSPPSGSFGNGEFDEDTNAYLDPVGALASGTGVACTTVEDAPFGSLAAVVSPSAGVSLSDQNSDHTGNVSHFGNGATICNLVGTGYGVFEVTFSTAGTYSVTVDFTPPAGDANFAAASAPPITVTVT